MTTRPQPFVTSVRVERSSGPHEYVSIWIRGANCGTLCVGKGDGDELVRRLRGESADGYVEISARLESRGNPVTEHRPDCRWAWDGSTCRCLELSPAEPALTVTDPGGVSASLEGPCVPCVITRDDERIPFVARLRGPPLRARGPWSTYERPFHVDPSDPPTLMDATPWRPETVDGALDRHLDRVGLGPAALQREALATHCPPDLAPDDETRMAAAHLGIHEAQLAHITRDFVGYWTGPAGHTLLADWQAKLRRRLYEMRRERTTFATTRQTDDDAWREEETIG